MWSTSNALPWERGRVYDPALSPESQATLNYLKLIGQEFQVPDYNLLSSNAGPNKPLRSAAPVTVMLCRNGSGGTLTDVAKKIVKIDPDNPGSVTALCAVADVDDWHGVADEYLTSTYDIPSGALFYVVTEGRSLCRTSASVSSTSITVGMMCAPATGGFINGTGTIHTLTTGIIDSAALQFIRNCRIEARTAYTGSAAAADIDVWVHKR
jgi:hypothetical protein